MWHRGGFQRPWQGVCIAISELRKRHETEKNLRCSEHHGKYLGIPSENKRNLPKSFQQERDPTGFVFK